MELRKRFSSRDILIGLYAVFLLAYAAVFVSVGLQPAGASQPEIDTELSIPAIGLESGVTTLQLEDHHLNTPETIVGSFSRAENKTLLIGHSSTVFHDLDQLELGDGIVYDEDSYTVTNRAVVAREDISMNKLLKKADEATLVLMTCAGQDLGNGEATHRLIITAIRQ